jgi:membrane associated rhomboid family serine protease
MHFRACLFIVLGKLKSLNYNFLFYLLQLYLMRDLERMCGPLRMAILYLGSGLVGNMASAIFVPFRAESGPAGSLFGLLAALVIEVVNVWPMLTRSAF